jgi:hypothetical protein
MAYALVAFVSSIHQRLIEHTQKGLTGDISNRPSEDTYGTSKDTLD